MAATRKHTRTQKSTRRRVLRESSRLAASKPRAGAKPRTILSRIEDLEPVELENSANSANSSPSDENSADFEPAAAKSSPETAKNAKNSKNAPKSRKNRKIAPATAASVPRPTSTRILDPEPLIDAIAKADVPDSAVSALRELLSGPTPADLPLDTTLRELIHTTTGVPVAPTPAREAEIAAGNMLKSLGREHVLEALALSSSPDAAALVQQMTDPATSSLPFLLQCRASGVEPARVLQLFRDYHIASAVASAAGAMPVLVSDLAGDSRSSSAPCGFCESRGIVILEKPEGMVRAACPACNGRGEIRSVGSDKARGLLLEIAGVRQKGGGGVSVNILNNAGAPDASSSRMPSMDEFAETTDRAIINVTPRR